LIVCDDLLFGEQLFRDLKPCLCHFVERGDILCRGTFSHVDALFRELTALQRR
jgi:hypothetical protein